VKEFLKKYFDKWVAGLMATFCFLILCLWSVAWASAQKAQVQLEIRYDIAFIVLAIIVPIGCGLVAMITVRNNRERHERYEKEHRQMDAYELPKVLEELKDEYDPHGGVYFMNQQGYLIPIDYVKITDNGDILLTQYRYLYETND